MPRFFIDTSDGDTLSRDQEGEEYASAEAAREAAIGYLPGIADAMLPDGEHRTFRSIVRDEAGTTIYEARLVFHGTWIAPPLKAATGSMAVSSGEAL